MAIQTFSVPLGGRVINAAGNFIRYESAGLEGADQRIKIRVDGNDLGEYLPGDAIELPYDGSLWGARVESRRCAPPSPAV